MIVIENPRAVIGGNSPPAATPFEAIKVDLEDHLTEAKAWADGRAVENQAQADAVSRLIECLRLSMGAAEAERVREKQPLDDKIEEIQARYNVYIAPLKNKVPGRVPKAIDALKACVKPYLDKLEADRQAAAELAWIRAEKAKAEAAEAARAAQASDLTAREAAEELVDAAHRAATEAKRIEAAKPQARGGDRAMGLRTTWTPELTDRKAALLHYLAEQPAEFEGLLMTLAWRDVRAGKRTIPGFNVAEGTTL